MGYANRFPIISVSCHGRARPRSAPALRPLCARTCFANTTLRHGCFPQPENAPCIPNSPGGRRAPLPRPTTPPRPSAILCSADQRRLPVNNRWPSTRRPRSSLPIDPPCLLEHEGGAASFFLKALRQREKISLYRMGRAGYGGGRGRADDRRERAG